MGLNLTYVLDDISQRVKKFVENGNFYNIIMLLWHTQCNYQLEKNNKL